MTATSYPVRKAAPDHHAPPSAARLVAGAVRLLAAAVVTVAIAAQITDQVVNDAFEAAEYFSFFTVQSSLINIIVLLAGGVLAVRRRDDPELFTAVRMATVAYAAVTAVVYNVLLRDLPSDGFVGLGWPGEIMHVWIPIVILLDWLLSPGRPALGWGRIWLAIGYPLAWVALTLVRGVVTGWYPYPFLDPDAPAGPVSVIAYIVAIAFFIIVVAAIAILVSRLGRSVLAERERLEQERRERERELRDREVLERLRGGRGTGAR
jgi:hypothetical protein